MEFYKNQNILVVAAHPDDEVLGCGGTIAKAVDRGAKVSVKFLGEGISARFPFGHYDSPEFKKQTNERIESAKSALDVLGIGDYEFGERLCTQFDKYPLVSIVKDIEKTIKKIKPNLLLTHNPSEVNIDHRIVYEAIEVATRPTRSWIPNEIYTFEIVCSGSWTYETSFKPNTFVDIEPYWQKKLDAWNCYIEEARDFPFPRSDEGLKVLAKYRGMAANLNLAEAFKLMRKICK